MLLSKPSTSTSCKAPKGVNCSHSSACSHGLTARFSHCASFVHFCVSLLNGSQLVNGNSGQHAGNFGLPPPASWIHASPFRHNLACPKRFFNPRLGPRVVCAFDSENGRLSLSPELERTAGCRSQLTGEFERTAARRSQLTGVSLSERHLGRSQLSLSERQVVALN